MARRRLAWTEHNVDKLNKAKEILRELEKYKPLTLRQIFYHFVGQGYIENTTSQYVMLSGLLKWARIDGHIAWEDIEDRVRAYHCADGWRQSGQFVRQEMDTFLIGYRRDLLQSQPCYIEAWLEKDALSAVFRRVAAPYCVSTVVSRGFTSVSFLREYKERLALRPDKHPILLYFGDFDPSGVEMLDSIIKTLEELDAPDIEFRRVALQPDDIFTYRLPHKPTALKKKDTRAKKHVEQYGELAVELDALPADILVDKIKRAIEEQLDLNLLQQEREREAEEQAPLAEMKERVIEFIQGEQE